MRKSVVAIYLKLRLRATIFFFACIYKHCYNVVTSDCHSIRIVSMCEKRATVELAYSSYWQTQSEYSGFKPPMAKAMGLIEKVHNFPSEASSSEHHRHGYCQCYQLHRHQTKLKVDRHAVKNRQKWHLWCPWTSTGAMKECQEVQTEKNDKNVSG